MADIVETKIYRRILLSALLYTTCQAVMLMAENDKPFMHRFEDGTIVTIDQKHRDVRSRVRFTIAQNPPPEDTMYSLSQYGVGSYDIYTNTTWSTEAQIQVKDGLVTPLLSRSTVKDQQEEILFVIEKRFDQRQKKIYWKKKDAQGKTVKEAVFPIKGLTADDTTLFCVLKQCIVNQNQPGYKYFYLLTNEPRLYRTNIKVTGQEKLTTPQGTSDCLKVKLTGDMGIVDDILDKYVPHTYVWVKNTFPHDWIQYQGMETDRDSTYIIATVIERTTDDGL